MKEERLERKSFKRCSKNTLHWLGSIKALVRDRTEFTGEDRTGRRPTVAVLFSFTLEFDACSGTFRGASPPEQDLLAPELGSPHVKFLRAVFLRAVFLRTVCPRVADPQAPLTSPYSIVGREPHPALGETEWRS